MIEIPFKRLDAEILQTIIEEFILREGTDYGAHEADFESKVAQVHHQIAAGDIVITYDPKIENCTLLTRHQFQRSIPVVAQDQPLDPEDIDTYQDYSQDMGGIE
ncbi:MAG: YheU family protein [Porticoccaceae bacterium]|nr:YheU family protein [Porticoccaceae bacterium]